MIMFPPYFHSKKMRSFSGNRFWDSNSQYINGPITVSFIKDTYFSDWLKFSNWNFSSAGY
jgi:hypothetical protein